DDHSVKIGITTIKLTREEFSLPQGRRSDEISSFAFLNLHENENTSVVAARSFLLTHGGSLVKFNNGFSRLISFQLSSGGATYSVDPNRIFTEEGIVATLKTYGPYSDEAVAEVKKLADEILSLYQFDQQSTVLALHNNGGTYGADDYLPGGTYQNDASQVNIVDGSNPSDFYYVVTEYYFKTLAEMGYNVVLQNNATVTNDGSLSYYSGIAGKGYINFEAQAEYTSFGAQVVVEFDMV
ncbi:unnamed protein product, partial [Ectocarpus fasciculatus]